MHGKQDVFVIHQLVMWTHDIISPWPQWPETLPAIPRSQQPPARRYTVRQRARWPRDTFTGYFLNWMLRTSMCNTLRVKVWGVLASRGQWTITGVWCNVAILIQLKYLDRADHDAGIPGILRSLSRPNPTSSHRLVTRARKYWQQYNIVWLGTFPKKMKQTQVKMIKLAHKTFTDTFTDNLQQNSFSKYCEDT